MREGEMKRAQNFNTSSSAERNETCARTRAMSCDTLATGTGA
jgi:hypothetical protein